MINESTLLEENKEKMRTGMNKAKDQFRDTTERWKEQAQDGWEEFTDLIRRNPGKALGIAVLAGVGLGTAVAAAARGRSRGYGASDKLRDLTDSGSDAWKTLRSGFSDALCSLKEAVDEAAAKFR